MVPKRFLASLVLGMTLVFMAPASAFAPVHKLAPKKVAYLSVFSPKAFALALLKNKSEFRCLDRLWTMESHWNPKADNPDSTAFGIAQRLGEKSKDAAVQIVMGIKYIVHRYEGSPCKALRYHFAHGSY